MSAPPPLPPSTPCSFKTIPHILEADHITINGDVVFGKNVTLRGTVIIVANEGNRIQIPDGSILENSASPRVICLILRLVLPY